MYKFKIQNVEHISSTKLLEATLEVYEDKLVCYIKPKDNPTIISFRNINLLRIIRKKGKIFKMRLEYVGDKAINIKVSNDFEKLEKFFTSKLSENIIKEKKM